MNTQDPSLINDSSKEEDVAGQIAVVEGQHPIDHNAEITRCDTAPTVPPTNPELPDDVLRIIFTFACKLDPRVYRKVPALIISHVCSAWRCTILNMPLIWGKLPFEFTFNTGGRYYYKDNICTKSPRICLLRLWLTRGGTFPRRLILRHSDFEGYPSDVIQRLIAPFPFRVLCLLLEWRELETLTEIPPEHMMSLESLSICCRDSHDHDERARASKYPGSVVVTSIPAGTLRLPTHIPKLLDLNFCDCFVNHLERIITAVPWNNLKQLYLQFDVPATTCLNVILRQGASLRVCVVKPTSDAMFSGLPDSEPPIVLRQMDTLALHCNREADVRKFKRLIMTPAASVRYISTYRYFRNEDFQTSFLY